MPYEPKISETAASLTYLISGWMPPANSLRGGEAGIEYAASRMDEIAKDNKENHKLVYALFQQRGGANWFESLTGLELDEGRIYRDIIYFQDCLECAILVEDEINNPSATKREIKRIQYKQLLRLTDKGASAPPLKIRQALVSLGTPAWADMEKVKHFYDESRNITKSTGVAHNVDHIVPIKHKRVCGLHNEFNLQVITKTENHKKGNRFYG